MNSPVIIAEYVPSLDKLWLDYTTTFTVSYSTCSEMVFISANFNIASGISSSDRGEFQQMGLHKKSTPGSTAQYLSSHSPSAIKAPVCMVALHLVSRKPYTPRVAPCLRLRLLAPNLFPSAKTTNPNIFLAVVSTLPFEWPVARRNYIAALPGEVFVFMKFPPLLLNRFAFCG